MVTKEFVEEYIKNRTVINEHIYKIANLLYQIQEGDLSKSVGGSPHFRDGMVNFSWMEYYNNGQTDELEFSFPIEYLWAWTEEKEAQFKEEVKARQERERQERIRIHEEYRRIQEEKEKSQRYEQYLILQKEFGGEK